MSPSIGPLPSAPRPPSTVSLPSGLGAGGRGKEKAPCRYLHFEVDYDVEDLHRDGGKWPKSEERAGPVPRPKLEIGLGPEGKDRRPQVGTLLSCLSWPFERSYFYIGPSGLYRFPLNGSTAISVDLIVRY